MRYIAAMTALPRHSDTIHRQLLVFAGVSIIEFSIPLSLYLLWREENPVIARIGKRVVVTQALLFLLCLVGFSLALAMWLVDLASVGQALFILAVPVCLAVLVWLSRLIAVVARMYERPGFPII